MHIECFDNSNTQGTNPVAACVVFRNGKPSKRDYRHFNIKTVVGANDYASMYEVVHRRYSRIIEEGGEMPQLILIDGGRGQLHFAYDALSNLGLLSDRPGNPPHPNFQKYGHIEVISIAERLEEIMIPDDPTPLFLDKNSPALKLLMHLRDEAHRFGITHHREKRTKNQITSTLLQIKGVGEATQQKLLQHFKSVKRLRAATLEEIEAVVGKSMARKIKEGL
jgi:excinuclease ABC subunit C